MRTSLFIMLAACGGGSGPDHATPDAGMTGLDATRDGDTTLPGDGIVFITSDFYDGNLKAAGAAATGLEGADNICQLHADAASLAGRYRAWLSTKDVDAVDRITGLGPWRNTKGELVFANRAQLQTHPVLMVGYDESGDGRYPIVWTGTAVGGREAPLEFNFNTTSTCADWTNNLAGTDASVYGDSAQASGAWTDSSYGSCYETHALYCFSVTP